MFRWPSTLDASPIFFASKFVSNPHARRSFAAELISHLRKYGFARVRNHGVALATIKGLFEYVRIKSILRMRFYTSLFLYHCARENSNRSDMFVASSIF